MNQHAVRVPNAVTYQIIILKNILTVSYLT